MLTSFLLPFSLQRFMRQPLQQPSHLEILLPFCLDLGSSTPCSDGSFHFHNPVKEIPHFTDKNTNPKSLKCRVPALPKTISQHTAGSKDHHPQCSFPGSSAMHKYMHTAAAAWIHSGCSGTSLKLSQWTGTLANRLWRKVISYFTGANSKMVRAAENRSQAS